MRRYFSVHMAKTGSLPLTMPLQIHYSGNSFMDLQEEVKAVEKELLDLIIAHLKANKIEVEKARQLARDFLAVLPVKDQKDLLEKLRSLGEQYEEAKEIYAEELAKVSEGIREQTLNQMRDFIKQGNIDSAIATAKNMPQAM